MTRRSPRSTAGSSSTKSNRMGRRTGCERGPGALLMTQGQEQELGRMPHPKLRSTCNGQLTPARISGKLCIISLCYDLAGLHRGEAFSRLLPPRSVLVLSVQHGTWTGELGEDRVHVGVQHEHGSPVVPVARRRRTRRANRGLRFYSLIGRGLGDNERVLHAGVGGLTAVAARVNKSRR